MSAPIPPPRGSSKSHDPSIWLEWRKTELKLKKSVKSLQQKASDASFSKDLENFRKLKMEQMDEEREILHIEQNRLDLQCETNEIDFPTFRNLQDDVISKIDTIMKEKWSHNQALRDLEVAAGKTPELGPDLNDALEAILFELYKAPGANKRNRTTQSNMRKEAFNAYAPEIGAEESGEGRCLITGEFFTDEDLKCGHIVPRFLSEDLVGYLIGVSPSRHINSYFNALIMCGSAEMRFDKGQFVLIPADEKESPIKRWKIWVLDQSAGNGLMGWKKLKDYHNSEIFFNNNNRPAARYLFAHYAISIMRMTKSRMPNYEERLRELADVKPFATPGGYLRKSLALKLWFNTNASHLGNLPFQNIISDSALFDDPNTMTNTEEDEAARRALVAPPEYTADEDNDDDAVFMTLSKHP